MPPDETTVTQPNTGGDPGQPSAASGAGDATGGDKTGTTFTQEQVNAMLATERKKNDERWKKKLDEQDEETKRQTAEAQLLAKGDYERLKAEYEDRLKKLEAKAAESAREALVNKVALKHSLPDKLASRLKGATEEELDADAAELAKLIVPVAPQTEAGRAGAARPEPLSIDELKRRKAETGLYSGI